MQTWEEESFQPTALYDISLNDVSFFVADNKCYILDGVNYLVYDGITVKAVQPYVPLIQLSKPPAGGGSAHEDFNLIGNKFKDSFSGDGTSTVYQMTFTGLDATPVTAVVGTTTINEGAGLTVDRASGKVTFTTAPASGTNNVIITAGKTVSGYADRIKNCTFAIGYGGSNDTRVFLSGNKNMPEYVWRSGLLDPSYWPENGYYKFTEAVMGMTKQYDKLIIERPRGKHQISYSLNNEGIASFPSKPINDKIGTYAKRSLQIIDNNPVSLSKDGVYMLVASNIQDERNVTHISGNIDKNLRLESGLSDAVSVDFDHKYWLAVNGKVYVLDYTQKSRENPFGEWYVYDNIPASYFVEMGGFLYFGSYQNGAIFRFDENVLNDDGLPIRAQWKSKALTFDADEIRKYIDSIYLSLNPKGETSLELYYESDKKSVTITGDKDIRFNLFDFSSLDFTNFTFLYSQFPQVFKRKVKAKKVSHFQLIAKNEKLNEGLTILSLGIQYRYQSYIK